MEPGRFKTEILLPEILAYENFRQVRKNLRPEQQEALKEQDEKDRLNPWVVLMKAYDHIYDRHLLLPLEKMAQNRVVDEYSSDFALTAGSRMLGFDLQEDFYGRITDKTLRHLLPGLGQYVDYNSGNSWAEFVGLLLDGQVRVDQLWTKDYVNFQAAPGGPTLQQSGPWFKTTHVAVSLSYVGYKNTLAEIGSAFSTDQARNLLEEYMPINLVIERLGFYVGFNLQVYVGAVISRLRQRLTLDPQIDPHLTPYQTPLQGIHHV